jgi:hypothetical protein
MGPPLTPLFVGAYELGAVGTLATWYPNGYAICADPVAGLEQISVTSASNSLSTKSITATRPAPNKATGVGAELGGLLTYGTIEDFRLNGSPPVSATTTGYEYISYSGSWTATSHAICADP